MPRTRRAAPRASDSSSASSLGGSMSFSLMVMQESLKEIGFDQASTGGDSIALCADRPRSSPSAIAKSSNNDSRGSLCLSESWEQGTASTSSLTMGSSAAPLSPASSPCTSLRHRSAGSSGSGRKSLRSHTSSKSKSQSSSASQSQSQSPLPTQAQTQTPATSSFPSTRTPTKYLDDRIEYSDGRVFIGHHVRGDIQHGTMIYADHTVFRGSWKSNKRHGHGHCTFPDGSSYEGHFSYGFMHGYGKLAWNDGGYYEGNWVEGKIHGRGREVLSDGSVRHDGFWENGNPICMSKGRSVVNVSNR